MTHEIEDRVYGPEITTEERAAINTRVTLPRPGVVLYREMITLSPASMNAMFDALDGLLATFDGDFVFILDLSVTRRPDAATRATLRQRAPVFKHRTLHMCVVLEVSNFLMSAVARLVVYSLGFRSVTFHPNVDEAMVEAERVLRR